MFCAWILISLSLYPLGWSNLTADGLDTRTLAFLAVTGIVFLALSLALSESRPQASSPPPVPGFTITLIVAYYLTAFWWNGGVPAIQLMTGQGFDVYGFGLPILHVPMLALTGYIGVRGFHRYLCERSRTDLFYAVASVAMLSAIANRSAVTFMLFCWFVVAFRRFRITAGRIVALLVLASGLLFAFGVFGNARLSNQIAVATGNDGSGAIASVARASDAFYQSGLPTELLWAYIYLVSPVMNLNQAFVYAGGNFCGPTCNLQGLVVWELLPDVFARRVAHMGALDEFDKTAFLTAPELTASTTFGSAVGYAGLLGAIVVLVTIILMVMLSHALLRDSDVREEGLAILACVLFFSFFENMISYSPLMLQLLLPLFRSRYRVGWL